MAAKVPELQRVLELRQALTEIKADLSNPSKMRELRKRVDAVLEDEALKQKLQDLKKID